MKKLTLLVIYIVKTKNAMNNLWFANCSIAIQKISSFAQRFNIYMTRHQILLTKGVPTGSVPA